MSRCCSSGAPSPWRRSSSSIRIPAIWTHPIVGGAPGTTPVLAVVGSFAWLVGGLAAALALWRVRASWLTIALTAAAGARRSWERARQGGWI